MLWKIKPGALTRGAIDAAAGAAPPGEAWVLANSWTYSSPVANVDFTGLAGYTDVRVLIRNVTTSIAGVRSLVVSTDNGSTFLTASGSYIDLSATGVETNTTHLRFDGDISSTAVHGGEIMISGWNLTANKVAHIRGRTDLRQCVIPTTSALNALRILNASGGGNLTGGNIYVFAR